MNTSYNTDVVAWANEQARLIRAGKFDQLDLEHIAEEIQDVGKSEQRELSSRMAVLLAHLLKWQHQPDRRTRSWTITLKNQRARIALAIKVTPSLKNSLTDEDWKTEAWLDALTQARKETGLDEFPEVCPWSMAEVLTEDWLPE